MFEQITGPPVTHPSPGDGCVAAGPLQKAGPKRAPDRRGFVWLRVHQSCPIPREILNRGNSPSLARNSAAASLASAGASGPQTSQIRGGTSAAAEASALLAAPSSLLSAAWGRKLVSITSPSPGGCSQPLANGSCARSFQFLGSSCSLPHFLFWHLPVSQKRQ